jgi:HIRAN domain
MSDIPTQKRSPRVSLTKRQLQSAMGVELVSLCQTITQDGRLDQTELSLLQGWLDAHQDASLPSVSYLTAIVKQVLNAGSITDEQLCAVYRAIEKILPPDVRETAREARHKLEIIERARLDAERPTQGEVHPQGWTSNPDYFDFMIAGVRHENRAVIIADRVTTDTRITLVRDLKNAFSPNAIEIRIESGEQIGFVPELDARELAPLLDSGATYETYIKKILSYGRCPIPVVVVKIIARPERAAQEMALGQQQATVSRGVEEAMQKKPTSAWRRWLGWA